MEKIETAKWEEFFKIRTIAFAKLEELRQNKLINKIHKQLLQLNLKTNEVDRKKN
jgi:hypothetical protein